MKNSEEIGTQKFNPVYKGHEFEALKLQFETQTSLLRYLTEIDLRIFTGYITMQLVLGGWLAQFPLKNLWVKIGILIIDLALTSIITLLLNKNSLRRDEVAGIVRNLNVALGFMEPGVYIDGKPLNNETKYMKWIYGYRFGLIVGVIGITMIIFVSP